MAESFIQNAMPVAWEYERAKADLLANVAQLWLVCDGTDVQGAGITQIHTEDGRKFCHIVAFAANPGTDWKSLLPELETFAKAEGCSSMEINGREGWKRALPDWSVRRVLYSKELI